MDFKEIKKLSASDSQAKLTELRQKVRELRFSIANNQLKNIQEIHQAKLMIARILTALKQTAKVQEPASQIKDHKE
jgi:ribosomal protein L29